jgi:CheY-like chemotaxis protein
MSKIRILVVEDDTINRFIILKHLSPLFECESAESGADAIQKLEKGVYDVVLMDINLGNDSLNGEDLLRIMRADKKFNATSIVAVTSYAMQGDRDYFLKAGFDFYHPKPILKEEIIQTVYKASSRMSIH